MATGYRRSKIFILAAERAHCPYLLSQEWESSGSTIGLYVENRTNILTLDIGLNILGMHSARETAAIKDIENLVKIFSVLYSQYTQIKG